MSSVVPDLDHPYPGKQFHFIIDFDGTITEEDTIDLLAKFAVEQSGDDAPQKRAQWKKITGQYAVETDRFDSQHPFDRPEHRTKCQGEVGEREEQHRRMADVMSHINGRWDIERSSVERVNESGIFDAVAGDQLYMEAQRLTNSGQIRIRQGFSEFIHQYFEPGSCGHTVLSINWSDQWIKGCLSSLNIQLDVISNRIEDGKVKGPGNPSAYNSDDSDLDNDSNAGELDKDTAEVEERVPKLLVNDNAEGVLLIASHKELALDLAREGGAMAPPVKSIYIGDSKTDLPCMLDFHFAIVMVDPWSRDVQSNTVVEMLTIIGYEVVHVNDAVFVPGHTKFAWARNFTEIMESGCLRIAARSNPPDKPGRDYHHSTVTSPAAANLEVYPSHDDSTAD